MAIVKIVDGDLVPTAFGKTNDVMNEIIVSGQMSANGVLTLDQFNGPGIDITLPFFSDMIVSGLGFSFDGGFAWVLETGIYQVNGVVVTIDEETPFAFSSPDLTRERIDAVIGDDQGAVATRQGTFDAQDNPVAPTAAAGEIILGLFTIDPASTGIDNSEVYVPPKEIAFNPRGSYNPVETYFKNDLVIKLDSSYVATRNNLMGEDPDGGPNWQLVAAQGPQGDTGTGVPIGGSAGQVLAKIDGADYNTEWVTPSGTWVPPLVHLGDFAAIGANGAQLLGDVNVPGLAWAFNGDDAGLDVIQATLPLGKDYDGSDMAFSVLISLFEDTFVGYDAGHFTFNALIVGDGTDPMTAPQVITETLDLSFMSSHEIARHNFPTITGLGYSDSFAALSIKITRNCGHAADNFENWIYFHKVELIRIAT